MFATPTGIGMPADGALAIAVFGGLLATPDTFVRGMHVSLLVAAAATAATAVLSLSLPRFTRHHEEN